MLEVRKLRTRWDIIAKCNLEHTNNTAVIEDNIERAVALEKDLDKAFNKYRAKLHIQWARALLEHTVEWLTKARMRLAELKVVVKSQRILPKGKHGTASCCWLCDCPDHWMGRCPLPPDEKNKRIKERELCRHCASPKHHSKYCERRPTIKCFICQGDHFVYLHEVVVEECKSNDHSSNVSHTNTQPQ